MNDWEERCKSAESALRGTLAGDAKMLNESHFAIFNPPDPDLELRDKVAEFCRLNPVYEEGPDAKTFHNRVTGVFDNLEKLGISATQAHDNEVANKGAVLVLTQVIEKYEPYERIDVGAEMDISQLLKYFKELRTKYTEGEG